MHLCSYRQRPLLRHRQLPSVLCNADFTAVIFPDVGTVMAHQFHSAVTAEHSTALWACLSKHPSKSTTLLCAHVPGAE